MIPVAAVSDEAICVVGRQSGRLSNARTARVSKLSDQSVARVTPVAVARGMLMSGSVKTALVKDRAVRNVPSRTTTLLKFRPTCA